MIRWTLLFVVLIIFSSGAVAVYTVFFRPSNEVVVPPLSAQSVLQAFSEAKRLGFDVQIEYVESSLPEGRVLAQSPDPGTRARKTQVIVLQVSRGSGERRTVPDVRGQDLARAQSIIREQGFSLGDVVRIRDGSQPGGTVIAQGPAAQANVPVTRKIDLLISEGGARDGSVTVPDVARMPEQEARNILAASGLRVQTVEKVFSPSMSEGLAIETRPPAGSKARAGDGVRLKLATLERPAGYTEPVSAQRPAPIPVQPPQPPATPSQTPPRTPQGGGVVVQVPGQGDIFIGDGSSANTPIREADPNVSVVDQERGARVLPAPSVQQPAPAAPPAPPPSSGGKVARIRYQVPPLASPLNLRIELVDPSGRRNVLDRQARSGENVYLEAPYSRECVVSVYLGGEFVWQEKHQ